MVAMESALGGDALVVLGMHRSGTSAIAGMMADLGCALPSDPLDPEPMNPKGFSESTGVSTLDDELMKAVGASWFDWRPLHVDRDSDVFNDYALRAVDTVIEVFGSSDFIVLKDPRMCRLVPFWEHVLATAGRTVSYVHVHRDPREVCASLERWAGYDPAYGELLWLRYVLDAELGTRGRTRAFVDYSHVLGDWQRVARSLSVALRVSWPRHESALPVGSGFIDGGLRRSVADYSQNLSPWTRRAQAVFEHWSANGEDRAQWTELDALRHKLDSASPAFEQLIDQGRSADIRARQLTRLIDSKAGEEGSLTQSYARALERIQRLSSCVERLERELYVQGSEFQFVRRQRDRLQRRTAGQMREGINGALHTLESMRAQLLQREEALVATRRSESALRDRVKELEDGHSALLTSRSWRVTAPLRRLSSALRRGEGRE